MNRTCYVASGDDRQQAFATLAEATQAALKAPWADGRVFQQDCHLEEFSGYAEFGGRLVFQGPDFLTIYIHES